MERKRKNERNKKEMTKHESNVTTVAIPRVPGLRGTAAMHIPDAAATF